MAGILRTILTRSDSATILVYILLNLTFAGIELTYGIWSNSLSLISDAFHMFFDSSGMTVGLVAQAIIHANWKNELVYTYGYGRADAVAGFANSCFLSFIVFMLTGEAVQRILVPPTVKTENLLQIAGAGLGINMFGLIVMWKNRSSAAQRRAQANRLSVIGVRNENHADEDHGILLGMLLHVIADALGSMGVIVSSLLIEKFGWTLADPVCSLVIAFFLVFGIIPLMNECIIISMQRTPKELDNLIPTLLNKIMKLPYVESIKDPHFWSLHKSHHIASCILVMYKDAPKEDADKSFWAAHELLQDKQYHIKYCTVEIEHSTNSFNPEPQVKLIKHEPAYVPLVDPRTEAVRQKKLKKQKENGLQLTISKIKKETEEKKQVHKAEKKKKYPKRDAEENKNSLKTKSDEGLPSLSKSSIATATMPDVAVSVMTVASNSMLDLPSAAIDSNMVEQITASSTPDRGKSKK